MDTNFIELDRLTLDELSGVVTMYPWFGVARKKLCLRTFQSGVDYTTDQQCAETGMYMCDKSLLYQAIRSARTEDYSDSDIKQLLGSFAKPRSVRAGAGDFFSQSDYDNVRDENDFVFSSFKAGFHREDEDHGQSSIFDQFCTETLAAIFAEQGYVDQAKSIYSKLILQNPEKSAYFASLIGKIDTENKNQ